MIYHDPPKRQESHHGVGEVVERTKAKLFSKQNSTVDNENDNHNDDDAKNESSQKSDSENKVSCRLKGGQPIKPNYSTAKPDYRLTNPDYTSAMPDNQHAKLNNTSAEPDNHSSIPDYSSAKPDHQPPMADNPPAKPDNPPAKSILSQLCRKFELQQTSSYHCRSQKNLSEGFSSANVRSLVCYFETSLLAEQHQFSM